MYNCHKQPKTSKTTIPNADINNVIQFAKTCRSESEPRHLNRNHAILIGQSTKAFDPNHPMYSNDVYVSRGHEILRNITEKLKIRIFLQMKASFADHAQRYLRPGLVARVTLVRYSTYHRQGLALKLGFAGLSKACQLLVDRYLLHRVTISLLK
jgi:RNase P subunit RPR2